MAKYTYTIKFGSDAAVSFQPDKDAVYKWQSEGSYDGFMRKKTDDIVITRDYDRDGTFPNATIFNTLWEWYFDSTKQSTRVTIYVYKDTVLDYTGIFYVSDGEIDVNDGFYTVKVETDDRYREFLQVMDDDVDIINNIEGAYQARYLYLSDQEGFDNGSPTAPTNATDGSPLPDLDGDGNAVWIPKTVPFVDGTWVRCKSQFNIDDGVAKGREYQDFWYYSRENINKNYYFPNCFKLIDVIQDILDTMLVGTTLVGMTFVSNFFNDPFNYVTGEVNRLMNTLIEQNSDTKDIDATNKATKGLLSFKDIIDDLISMFDVKWYIDDDLNLRIEHRLFFYNGMSKTGYKDFEIDLTDVAKYTDETTQKLYIEDNQKYEGTTEELIRTETIEFITPLTYEFRDDMSYIEYDVLKGVATKRKHNVAVLATDLGKAINTPDNVDDDGFHIFNCEYIVGGTGYIITKPRQFDYLDFQIGNAGFGTKWLLRDYYEYGRQDKSGILHTNAGTFAYTGQYAVLSTAPIFFQKDIVFLLNNADNIDVNKYIATYLIKSDGSNYIVNGSIEEIEQDLNDDFVTATLGYEL